jgi:hypothetical protein
LTVAQDFYLDEDDVDKVVRRMRHTGDEMAESFALLDSTLTEYVGCWGDDKIGKAFQGGYWENSQKMLNGYREAGANINDSAKNLADGADLLATVDKDTARRLDSEMTEQE